jgi:hypothetical protein
MDIEDRDIWKDIYKKYTPIGKHWIRIDSVGGTRLYGVRADFPDFHERLAKLRSLLPLVEAEYETRAEIRSQSVEHGYSGRDGGVSIKVDHFDVYIEADQYSFKDSGKMQAEYFAKKYPRLRFKKPPPAFKAKRIEPSLEKKLDDLLRSKRNKEQE